MLSKREKMTYIVFFTNEITAVVGLIIGTPILELSALIGAIDAVAVWYLQKETERKSEL